MFDQKDNLDEPQEAKTNSDPAYQEPEILSEYVLKGIKKGKRKKRNSILKKSTGILLCVVFTFLLVGIRVSPTLASDIAKIPGLRYLVEMVNGDKGLSSAVQNEYIQNINASCEKLGIVLTVKDIIVDNSGIEVFYSIENKLGYKWPGLEDPRLLDGDGKRIEASAFHGSSPTEERIHNGRIEYHFVKEEGKFFEIPELIYLDTNMRVAGLPNAEKADNSMGDSKQSTAPTKQSDSGPPEDIKLDARWNIAIPIDKSKIAVEKIYEIGKTVEVEGQKIIFNKMTIFPTRIILDVSADKSNSKSLYNFDDIKIINEKGEEWLPISGVTALGNFESSSIQLLFQSNYFYDPSKLSIMGSSIRALDKDKGHFLLDIEKEKLLEVPDNLLSLVEFTRTKDEIYINIEVGRGNGDEPRQGGEMGSNTIVDANGKEIQITGSGGSCCGEEGNRKYYENYKLKINKDTKGL